MKVLPQADFETEEETEDLKPQIKPVFKKEKKSLSQLLENLGPEYVQNIFSLVPLKKVVTREN